MARCLAFLSLVLLISLPAMASPISAEPAVGDVVTLQRAEIGVIEFTIITAAGHVRFSVPENMNKSRIKTMPCIQSRMQKSRLLMLSLQPE